MDRENMEPEETRNQVIAERLRSIRGPRSQEWIAERMGVHAQTVWRYEKGEIPGSWDFLMRLREAEGIDLNALLATPAAVESIS
jgi:transcriptional regulator with XRE-family HTH domain